MATWDDVERFALALPEVTEGTRMGGRVWRIRDKAFVWDRPLRRKDLEELGPDARPGPIVGVHTETVDDQQALVQGEPDYCFMTTHFTGFPAVLIQLDAIPPERLRELIIDSWLKDAPKRLAKEYLEAEGLGAGGRTDA